ncbi:MAG: hypothetical protein IKK43_03890 [Clostridia bacterium]|nr:hypothetical protein [Clostridia bacterium]
MGLLVDAFCMDCNGTGEIDVQDSSVAGNVMYETCKQCNGKGRVGVSLGDHDAVIMDAFCVPCNGTGMVKVQDNSPNECDEDVTE